MLKLLICTSLLFFFSSRAFCDEDIFLQTLTENQIDTKFEEFEGGSFDQEAIVHKQLINFSFDLMNNMYSF